jgi:hypothetical protein
VVLCELLLLWRQSVGVMQQLCSADVKLLLLVLPMYGQVQ